MHCEAGGENIGALVHFKFVGAVPETFQVRAIDPKVV